ncbi:MAG: SDR family NAD(P)-dependent oxidoreductase [Gammaproteobacteria bacterium]|nr:SDR family NAD(P)-dependent oxidoreductase [Gammaproteobacteria bacterium]MDH4255371.1 SDR family NAD(P)-dependent oxidoreductase [Gammaproteobacteria bacterium]MDH5309548.1 SDR family NAD(P)-dependent oxidoreductase [Gammaproteobacteria bacterium]
MNYQKSEDPQAARLSVEGRVAMVSGASRGIGLAIARQLLADGYRVSIGVRDVASTREVYSDVSNAHLLVAEFDACDPGSAAAWVGSTLDRFGRIHALVNNAGIWRKVGFDSGDEADLDELWEVNAKAPFRLTRLVLPHLRACGTGRIVNIASTDGVRFRDLSCSVGYTMSKHALVALSHASRHAGYDDGVRVTALCPGAVATEMVAGLPGVTPLARQLPPATVAQVVAMLLALPNNASVAWMPLNTRLESTL